MAWVLSKAAWAVAGVFSWLSLLMTLWQIYMHLLHFNRPAHQRWIIRVLLMAPIYALASWLSLGFNDWAIYFDTVRNCYEG